MDLGCTTDSNICSSSPQCSAGTQVYCSQTPSFLACAGCLTISWHFTKALSRLGSCKNLIGCDTIADDWKMRATHVYPTASIEMAKGAGILPGALQHSSECKMCQNHWHQILTPRHGMLETWSWAPQTTRPGVCSLDRFPHVRPWGIPADCLWCMPLKSLSATCGFLRCALAKKI